MPEQQFYTDGDSSPYWDGIAHNELRIQQCNTCKQYVFYPRSICPHCHSDSLSWITASGEGTIYSYTVVHQAFGSFASEVPFIVAIVELREGVRMMTRILEAPREQVAIGAPVRVSIESVGEKPAIPYFRLIESS